MEHLNSSITLILGLLTFFTLSNAKADIIISHQKKNSYVDYFSKDKKFIETINEESLNKLEA